MVTKEPGWYKQMLQNIHRTSGDEVFSEGKRITHMFHLPYSLSTHCTCSIPLCLCCNVILVLPIPPPLLGTSTAPSPLLGHTHLPPHPYWSTHTYPLTLIGAHPPAPLTLIGAHPPTPSPLLEHTHLPPSPLLGHTHLPEEDTCDCLFINIAFTRNAAKLWGFMWTIPSFSFVYLTG